MSGVTRCLPGENVLYPVIKRKYDRSVQLRYNYRLYPSPGQRAAMARAFECARVVFNDALRLRQDAYAAGLPYLTDAEVSAALTAAKKTSERAWLGEVSAVILQQALADLNTAYRNFFASLAGQRKGPKVEPPRFRSRKDRRQAVRFTANAKFKILGNGRLRLPKIGDVPVRWSRDLPSAPSTVTVIRDAAGRYFASFVVAADPAADAARFPAGLDLGGRIGLRAGRRGELLGGLVLIGVGVAIGTGVHLNPFGDSYRESRETLRSVRTCLRGGEQPEHGAAEAGGARAATAADSAVSPQPMPSPARMNPAASSQGWRGPAVKTPYPAVKQIAPAARTRRG